MGTKPRYRIFLLPVASHPTLTSPLGSQFLFQLSHSIYNRLVYPQAFFQFASRWYFIAFYLSWISGKDFSIR